MLIIISIIVEVSSNLVPELLSNASSACEDNKGGCEHICEDTSGSAQCLCYRGYVLAEDGQTCIGKSKMSEKREKKEKNK